MISRRNILKAAGTGILASALPGVSFANRPGEARLVLIILRGAVDGLAVAAPYGDGNYARMRGELALPSPGQAQGLLKLDGLFGLHPELSNLHKAYENEQALVVHAVASPYRQRSHFDGQDLLENGGNKKGVLRDGWLSRALSPLASTQGQEAAIAMAQNTPLILRGSNSVTSWAPSRLPDADDNTIARLQDLYADDAFFASRLAQALKSQEIADDMSSNGRGNDAERFRQLMQSTARFLIAEDGPRIAVLEAGGWDTHANQGAERGALANRLRGLDSAIAELQNALDSTWDNTVVMVVTEFGRTVRVNGTRGTDHGTGTVALLTGGAVNGGKVVTDWPGMSPGNLYQERDLKPTTDIRSIFKGVLADHLALDPAFLDREVFPGSDSTPLLQGLVRKS